MCTSVEQKNAIILQVEASWQYICACIHTAEHHVIATEFYRRCFFFFCLSFRSHFSGFVLAATSSVQSLSHGQSAT